MKSYIDNIIKGNDVNFDKTIEGVIEAYRRHIEDNKLAIALKEKDANGKDTSNRKKDKNGNEIEPKFRFGNAQKLVNMVSKYMYSLVYKDERLRKNFEKCHCPMDSFMMRKVKEDIKGLAKEDKDEEATALLEKWKEKVTLTWSRMENKEQYEVFQECVGYLAKKKSISKVEYDYDRWQ